MTVRHSCGCRFSCAPGYAVVGSQPYCEQGYLSSSARCVLSGCTDSMANNFNPLAKHNNGSCAYSNCTAPAGLRPSNGGSVGSCPAGSGANMTHGQRCELSCAEAALPAQCSVLPGGKFRHCNGACVPRDACSYAASTDAHAVVRGYISRRLMARAARNSGYTRRGDTALALGSQPQCLGGRISVDAHCLPAGCTDSLALNYRADRVVDDGSCEYTCQALSVRFAPATYSQAVVMSCAVAQISPVDVAESRRNCERAGDCTYIPHVTEACAPTDVRTCPAADISGDATASRLSCLGAGTCHYTAHVPMIPETCVATDEASCAAVDISSPDIPTSRSRCVGAGACTYVAHVMEVLEACVALDAYACAAADISGDWRTSRYLCLNAAVTPDGCTYIVADPSRNIIEACVATATAHCRGVQYPAEQAGVLASECAALGPKFRSCGERKPGEIASCVPRDSCNLNAERAVACESVGVADIYGHQVCAYTTPVTPVVEVCFATDKQQCDIANITTNESTSRSTCNSAGQCTYTAYSAEVVENCADVSAQACLDVDLSGAEPASRAACESAGACTYTAHVTEACPPTNASAIVASSASNLICTIIDPTSDGWTQVAAQGGTVTAAPGRGAPVDPALGVSVVPGNQVRVIQGRSDQTNIAGRFYVQPSGVLILRHLKIANQSAPPGRVVGGFDSFGGAVVVDSGNVTVEHCLFITNTALTSGGAIYAFSSVVAPNTANHKSLSVAIVITHSQFVRNSASGGVGASQGGGGALYVETRCTGCAATVHISNTEFQSNSGRLGGAIHSNRGDIRLDVADSLFLENGNRGDLSDLAQIGDSKLQSLISDLRLNAPSASRVVGAFRSLGKYNPIRWVDQSIAEWVKNLGLGPKEAIVRSYIVPSTVEGGAVYIGGEACEGTDQTLCNAVVLDNDEALARATCIATALGPQARLNGEAARCTYRSFVQEVVEWCRATDYYACTTADISSPVESVSRYYCIVAGQCTYIPASPGVSESCIPTAHDTCESADMGDFRPATGDPATGDELSCVTTCPTACSDSCTTSCTPVSLNRCNAASSAENGSCTYDSPVIGVPKSCVSSDLDKCSAADLSGDWRASQRKCEAAGRCSYHAGGNSVTIRSSTFEHNVAVHGRHIQAILPQTLRIRETKFLDYADGDVEIIPGLGSEPGCRGYPCSVGHFCTDTNQSTFCQKCPEGTFSADGIDCTPCPPGFQPGHRQSSCEPCPTGLYSPGWGALCASCRPGFQSRNESHLYRFVSGECVDFNGMTSHTGGQPRTQTQCVGGRLTWRPSSCIAANDIISNGMLVATGQTQEQCSYPTNCESCLVAEVDVDGRIVADGKLWSDGHSCQRCSVGYQPSADRSSCQICVNQYSPDGAMCHQCPAGMQPDKATGGVICVNCSSVGPSMVSVDGGMCISCEGGQQPNVAVDSARGTTAGCDVLNWLSNASSELFRDCNGTCVPRESCAFINAPPRSICVACAHGRFSLKGVECNACPPGHQPNSGKWGCDGCQHIAANLYSPKGYPCEQCVAGKQPNTQHSRCVTCPQGYMSSNGHCNICPSGQQPTANQEGCELCMYADVLVGNIVVNDTFFWSEGHRCRRCDPGSEPNARRTDCQKCIRKYSPDGGQCLQCLPGSQPVSVAGASACVHCSMVGDSVASVNGSLCVTCSAGQQPNSNRSACERCPPGRASLLGKPCKVCDTGSAPNSAQSSCELCPAGRFSPQGTMCYPSTECSEMINGSNIPAITRRVSKCVNIHGMTKSAAGRFECEKIATGNIWTPAKPSVCTNTTGNVSVLIAYGTLQPICELTRTTYAWDTVWSQCKDSDGRAIVALTSEYACHFVPTGNAWTPGTTWRAQVPGGSGLGATGQCTTHTGFLVAARRTRADCEYDNSGYVWTDARPIFGSGSDSCVRCEPGTQPSTEGDCSGVPAAGVARSKVSCELTGSLFTPRTPAHCTNNGDASSQAACEQTGNIWKTQFRPSQMTINGPVCSDGSAVQMTVCSQIAPCPGQQSSASPLPRCVLRQWCTTATGSMLSSLTSREACEMNGRTYTAPIASHCSNGGDASTQDACERTGLSWSPDGSRCEQCPEGQHSTDGVQCSRCAPGSQPMRCANSPILWSGRTKRDGFMSKASATCADYQKYDLCTIRGGYGAGWNISDGVFADWANEGVDATQACCVCGGGRPTLGTGVCLRCASVGPSIVSNDGGICTSCSAGFQPNAIASLCEACPPGRASLLGEACVTCAPGRAPNANRSTCDSCAAGRFSADGVECVPFEQCNSIFPGTHVPVHLAQSPRCRRCPDGTMVSREGVYCDTCAPGRASVGGEPCAECPAGKIGITTVNCTVCGKPGMEPNMPQAATSCQPCTNGQYSSGLGTFCAACWPNSVSSVDRATCDCSDGWQLLGFSLRKFTGGDRGEGLDMSGPFVYALDVGGSGGMTIRNATFTVDNVPGAKIMAYDRKGSWGRLNQFGASLADNALESLLRSVRYSVMQIGSATIAVDIVAELAVTPGHKYRLQLLFVEKTRDRSFAVAVDGELVMRFSPQQVHSSDVGAGAVLSVDLIAKDTVLDVVVANATSIGVFLQALTLMDGHGTGTVQAPDADFYFPTMKCTNANECSINNGGCDKLTTCIDEFGGRSCSPCPSGFVDAPSKDYSAGSGNITCVANTVTGSTNAAPLREVSMQLAADKGVLVKGSAERATFIDRLQRQLARSLNISVAAVQITSVASASTPQHGRRRQLQQETVSVSFVLLSANEAALLDELNAQLADLASPLLNSSDVNAPLTAQSVVPNQDLSSTMAVGCPIGLVLHPVDQVCSPCKLGQHIVNGACEDCGQGLVGDAVDCKFCDPGSEPAFRDRTRAVLAATDCRRCSEIDPAYATAGNGVYCAPCAAGAQPNHNRASCVRCEDVGPNVVSDGVACEVCLAGKAPSADRSVCEPCNVGQASNGTLCEDCPPGFFGGNGTEATCQRCPVSSYSTSNASFACTSCPSKSDTRGLDAQMMASACLCSGNPDNPTGGSYNASLYYVRGYSDDLRKDLETDGLVVRGVDSRYVEVASCWEDGELVTSSSSDRAANHYCVVCPQCFRCAEDTGSDLHPMPGYWRRSVESPKAHKCFYRYGCLGGVDSECNTSYTGALCGSCEQGYTPSETECEECPHGVFAFLFAAGAAGIFFSMAVFIIGQNNAAMKEWTRRDALKHGPKEPELITVASRTLFAFLQVQTLSGDFRLNWPGLVVEVNAVQGMLSETSVLMHFLACVQPPATGDAQTDAMTDTPWAFTRAAYVLVLLPVACIIVPAVWFFLFHIWSIVKSLGGASKENMANALKGLKAGGAAKAKSLYADKYISSVVILLFILHPSLVRETLYLLPCQRLEDGLSVLRTDPGIVCGTPEHVRWMLMVAIPSMVVWCGGRCVLFGGRFD
jgi:predicted outer membrane repeat protein